MLYQAVSIVGVGYLHGLPARLVDDGPAVGWVLGQHGRRGRRSTAQALVVEPLALGVDPHVVGQATHYQTTLPLRVAVVRSGVGVHPHIAHVGQSAACLRYQLVAPACGFHMGATQDSVMAQVGPVLVDHLHIGHEASRSHDHRASRQVALLAGLTVTHPHAGYPFVVLQQSDGLGAHKPLVEAAGAGGGLHRLEDGLAIAHGVVPAGDGVALLVIEAVPDHSHGREPLVEVMG